MDINNLAKVVSVQADVLFPQRTQSSMFLKLFSEIGEMVDNPDSPDEVADVFIMLLDHAHRKGIDLAVVITEKMKINATRTWTISEIGVFRHVDK